MNVRPGTIIGRYRVLGDLGHDDATTTYRALDTQQQRPVTLKLLLINLTALAQPEVAEHFRREAAAALLLTGHPHIASVYAIGQVQHVVYIATEFIDGVTLAQYLTEPLAPNLAVKIVTAIASALDAAHAIGVLHRDVKSSSIALGQEGRIALSDFGVAALVSSVGQAARPGAVVAAPEYVAPEMAAGEASEPASDQYSLAVLTYEMLTGRRPFHADNAMALLYAHISKRPTRPSSVRDGLPASVDDILLRGLAKEPGQRFPDCAAFAVALGEALGIPVTFPEATIAGSTLDVLLAKTEELASAGDYDGALRTLEAGLKLAPGDAHLEERQAELRNERRLAELYAHAMRLLQAREWIPARDVLNDLYTQRPDYRNVRELRRQAFISITLAWRERAQHERSAKASGAGPAVGGPRALAAADVFRRQRGARRGKAKDGQEDEAEDERAETPAGGARAAEGADGEATGGDKGERDEAARRSVEVMAPSTAVAAIKGAHLLSVPRTMVEVRWVHTRGRESRSRLKKYRVTVRGQDGTFTLRLEGERIHLTVYRPEGGGRPVSVGSVMAELADWPAARVDQTSVEAVVKWHRGEPVAVGALTFSYLERSGLAAGLGVVVSPDEMTAHLVPTRALSQVAASVSDVQALLKRAGIVAGLDDSAIARFAAEAVHISPVVAARGVRPRPGTPPRIVSLFGSGDQPSGVAVQPGTPLLALQPGTEGVPGTTVTGRQIPAAPLPSPDLAGCAGPGTGVAPDGRTIVATFAGAATFDGQTVSVTPPETGGGEGQEADSRSAV